MSHPKEILSLQTEGNFTGATKDLKEIKINPYPANVEKMVSS